MKVKIFFQLHIVSIICYVLAVISIFSGVYLIIYCNIICNGGIVYIIGGVLALIPALIIFCSHSNIVLFGKNHITTPGQFLPKLLRTQYKLEIAYNEIISVNIVMTSKNSKRRQVSGDPHMAWMFLEFGVKNKNYELLTINWFTKKQKIKIINELKKRLVESGNYIDIGDPNELLSVKQ